jgi:hypothetical protein
MKRGPADFRVYFEDGEIVVVHASSTDEARKAPIRKNVGIITKNKVVRSRRISTPKTYPFSGTVSAA